MTTTAQRQVPCPDCGQLLTPRGLGGHRRLRHGLQPAGPLPARGELMEAATPEVLEALTLLRGAVERIEDQLHRLQEAAARRETPREEEQRLAGELAFLLERIGRIERARKHLAGPVQAPSSQGEFLQTAATLGRLRREQTRLVCRMDELRRGVPREESLWS